MVEGIIDELGQPMISILLRGLRCTATIMAVVDAGFTGHVSVPIPVAVHLGLELIGLEAFELADGTQTEEFVFIGRVGLGSEEWEVPILLTPDSFFCPWCSTFVPALGKGEQANLFARWVAMVIDPLIAVVLYLLAIGIFGSISEDLAVAVAVLLPLAYVVWFLSLLRNGRTPGKQLLGLQVVHQQTGEIPGFGKMFVREIIG